jgi:hypothetical protein
MPTHLNQDSIEPSRPSATLPAADPHTELHRKHLCQTRTSQARLTSYSTPVSDDPLRDVRPLAPPSYPTLCPPRPSQPSHLAGSPNTYPALQRVWTRTSKRRLELFWRSRVCGHCEGVESVGFGSFELYRRRFMETAGFQA